VKLTRYLLFLALFIGTSSPGAAQALIPHTVTLDFAQLQKEGLAVAQDAAQRAQLLQSEDMVAAALAQAELATELAPNDYRIWALVADLNLRSNQIPKAIEALEKAKVLAPTEPAVLFALGSAHFRQQEYAKSVTAIQAGLKLKPDVPGALFDLGNAFYVQKRYPEALEAYDKAIRRKKDFWEAINNVALVQYEQNQVTSAFDNWRKAIGINGKAAEPQLALAAALYAKGERVPALKLAETALRIDKSYSDVKFLKEQLWGDRLLRDAQTLLENPQLRDTLLTIPSTSPEAQ
jgi:tetratricopeptide (TPR) repeat protein